jgi:hypothetical protein
MVNKTNIKTDPYILLNIKFYEINIDKLFLDTANKLTY